MAVAEAIALNKRLEGTIAQRLLSEAGAKAYYPRSGIPGQTIEANGTRINAALGQAYDEEGQPLILESFAQWTHLPPTEVFPYAPTHGVKALRDFWKSEIRRKNELEEKIRISTPVVTSGLAHGLTIAQQLFIDEGDPLIIFKPFWGNYRLHYEGADFHEIEMYDRKSLNLHAFEETLQRITTKKKIISLTFPSNPTGYMPSFNEAQILIKIIEAQAKQGDNIAVIIDDAYFGLVYENEKKPCKESFFAPLAKKHENLLAIKVDGITKEAFSWGLRVGFLTFAYKGMTEDAAKALEDKVAGRVRATISGAALGSQYMALHGMQDPHFEEQLKRNRLLIAKRVDAIKKTLAKHPEYEEEFTALPFNAGYFMCLQMQGGNANEIRTSLRKEHSIGVLSLEDKLRIAHSSVPLKDIPELFQRIYEVSKSMKDFLKKEARL
ncbi:aminotransferase class I/II-fold pyridoxal phosphate-dependent enzyme [Candidatus Woesearchaeota archaeon]|nr:aminotransferase class I/II-fold pyridoxal phosphate-dependent enzyme [Candidatus Woesearchaeota archaeon]